MYITLLGDLRIVSLSLVIGCVVLMASCSSDSPAASPAMTVSTLEQAYETRPTYTPTPLPASTPSSTDENGPVTVSIAPEMPEEYAAPLLTKISQIDSVSSSNGDYPVIVLDQVDNADTQIRFVHLSESSNSLAERYYAVVVPFETVRDTIALDELRARWQGMEDGKVLVAGFSPGVLNAVLGKGAPWEVSRSDLLRELSASPNSIGIVPFDMLDPRFKALAIDGVSVLDNQLEPTEYGLALALEVTGHGASLLHDDLIGLVEPYTNRDASQLSTLIMTGVTAISRGTAAAIERNWLTYPADVISDTLSAADITHVSNEVPFLDDCVVNNTLNNLTLCSHTDYSATLLAIGTDIVGLSGNHVNDFGREGARRSLRFYRENRIPIYGSGFDEDQACEPLLWEHNGNTFAFIAALAFGPESAWATEEEPGACYYYDNKEMILQMVQKLSKAVDVVSVELQFEEAYDVHPLAKQVTEFRELREAGADIVTGVQSHVPQAMETYGVDDAGGPGVIAYGLGNLFFDQMWSWPVRTGLISRHTIYDGEVMGTEILTTVLEDFAQPRWASEEEREAILTQVFAAAPPRPSE